MSVQVGVALGTIDVPEGTPMAGFAARSSASTGTHDPLSVRALVIGTIGLVTVDCCALHELTCRAVRAELLAEQVVTEVVLHATHTHAGPCVSLERLGCDSPEVRTAIERAVAVVVRRAAADRAACTVSWAEAHGTGIAKDRRHLDREIDPPVQAVGFDREGRRRATLVSYPCHPVVLDAANTFISGDYIAALRGEVEAEHPESICVFATGAAGDINTGHSAEASFVAGGSARSFTEAEHVGRALAGAVSAASVTPVLVGEPGFTSAEVELELEAISDREVAAQVRRWRRELDDRSTREALLREWLRWAEERPSEPATTWSGRVSLIDCGPLRIVALPGEPFYAAVVSLRARHDGPMIVLGYCDGVPGYLPEAAAYAEGGYEVADAHRYYAMPAPFAQGSLERVIDAAAALVERGGR